MRNGNSKGFTLIELLIVVAIIGIIAAIAIPNLLNAIQRGKQKRTMGDLRTIATAVESYSIDNNRYPSPSGSVSGLAPVLEPLYIRELPHRDGWQTEIRYDVNAAGTEYTLISYGRDGAADSPVPSGPTTSFNSDIVFSTGSFVAWPEGTQT